jgi:dephospho-CoA kinase
MKVGLTGGIGSGKTTLLNEFVKLGAVGYIADDEARMLMNNHPVLIAKIKGIFGAAAYENGALNRSLISSMIFEDQKLLELVNNAVRPFVYQHLLEVSKQYPNKVVIYESAILLESDFRKSFDLVITINANKAGRVKRVEKRNGWNSQKIENILNSQYNDQQRSALADLTIDGNNLEKAKVEVEKMYKSFLKKAT